LLEIKSVPTNALIIIEDVIHLTKKEETLLRYYLNEYAHHKTLKIFCVGHTLFKTSLYGIISLFNFIVFTSSSSNVPLLKQALRYFTLTKDEISEYLNLFESVNKQGLYYYLDCQTVAFKAFSMQDSGCSGDNNKLKRPYEKESAVNVSGLGFGEDQNKKFEKSFLDRGCALFEDHPLKHKARGILSIVTRALPFKVLSDTDITVSFFSADKCLRRKISLVDYIQSLLDAESGPPEQQFRVLHTYIQSKCQIPKALILNKHFK